MYANVTVAIAPTGVAPTRNESVRVTTHWEVDDETWAGYYDGEDPLFVIENWGEQCDSPKIHGCDEPDRTYELYPRGCDAKAITAYIAGSFEPYARAMEYANSQAEPGTDDWEAHMEEAEEELGVGYSTDPYVPLSVSESLFVDSSAPGVLGLDVDTLRILSDPANWQESEIMEIEILEDYTPRV